MLLAALNDPRTWTLKEFFIFIILFLGGCAIIFIAAKALGWTIPDWLQKMALVVIIVLVALFCIVFMFSFA